MREKLPELKIKIGDQIYETNFQKDVEISRETVSKNMIEQPSLFAWYAVLTEMVEREVNDRKLELAILGAKTFDRFKTEGLDAGEKITDKRIDSLVKQDDDYIAAVAILDATEGHHGILKAITKAFDHRKDMLINLGSFMRAEMDTDISTKAEKDRFRKD